MSLSEMDQAFATMPDPTAQDRVPPQDIAAEQSVLGSMLLSKDAIGECSEIIQSIDFYRPAHETIHEAIVDLFSRGEPVDAITVADELSKRGDLTRVGGTAFLHQLIASVPTAANASYYAQIVTERAMLRRLVEAGTRIVQMGYAQGGGDVEEIVNMAQAEVYGVADRRKGEDYHPLSELLEPTLDEIEHAAGSSGEMVGVPTGFTSLDELTNGLHPGQMIIVAARPAVGKALALDTPLPTPTGWTTMGEVRVGDQLLGADGLATTVTAATDVMHKHRCYEVKFFDGSTIVADADHQWVTQTREEHTQVKLEPALAAIDRMSRRVLEPRTVTAQSVRTTAQIAATLRVNGRTTFNHSVAVTRPLSLPEVDLPAAPYVLGAWLGDSTGGEASTRTAERDVESKRIPMVFQRSSVGQRQELLAGILDAGGTLGGYGEVQFTCTSARLTDHVHELIVGLGHPCRRSVQEVRGESDDSCSVHTLTFDPADDVFWLKPKQDKHRKERQTRPDVPREKRFITAVRRVKWVPVRCVQVDNEDHLFLAGTAMIPTHNSTFALDVARTAAIKHKIPTVVFSLEMSRTEITMRLLSAESEIPLQHMRKGKLEDRHWTKLAETQGRLQDMPLFIDDSPNMALMEIRAKCRRLKQRHNLKLVIVDYLQLMSSGKRVESRQQEVAEFSRALKLLAKELEVPVIALSQLNRGPEQRVDKKPQMSDLRESGCLTADTRVLCADSGAEVTLGELHASGVRDVPVWSLDESLRYVRRHLTHVFSTGTKPVFRLTLSSGKTLRATENHPFLTYQGWKQLGDLRQGDRIAVPRHVPAPEEDNPWKNDHHLVLLAHMLGDGSMLKRQPLRYASVDQENLRAVEAAVLTFGVVAVRDEYPAARCTTLRLRATLRLARGRRNPIAEWLDGLGVFGLRSPDKFVPEEVFSASKRQIALFLHHIWATDGSVTVNASQQGGRIYYASTSRRLVDDLSLLLLRFGISTRTRVTKTSYRDGYTIDISGPDSQRRFLQEIGVFGGRSVPAAALLAIIRHRQGNTNVDTVPVEVWDDIRDEMLTQGMTTRDFQAQLGTQHCGSAPYKSAPSRERLGRIAEVLDSAALELRAVNDVLWDQITSIEPDGVEEVFDATVLGGHNFVANGIAVHNSIEQDADVVILLHRESMYERESPREGEADVIVAKHRNGPTDTIVVAFQGHYSRFTNMATNF